MEPACMFCGARVDSEAKFCPACGARRDPMADPVDLAEIGPEKDEPRDCLRCRGPMTVGAILPRTFSLTGSAQVIRWYRGPARFSKLFGDQRPADDATGLAVRAYRCEKCGYLELTATDPMP